MKDGWNQSIKKKGGKTKTRIGNQHKTHEDESFKIKQETRTKAIHSSASLCAWNTLEVGKYQLGHFYFWLWLCSTTSHVLLLDDWLQVRPILFRGVFDRSRHMEINFLSTNKTFVNSSDNAGCSWTLLIMIKLIYCIFQGKDEGLGWSRLSKE